MRRARSSRDEDAGTRGDNGCPCIARRVTSTRRSSPPEGARVLVTGFDARCRAAQRWGQGTGNKDAAAKKVGTLIAERAKAAGITRVAFDRSGFKYHGRVKALAEAAREGGLEF